MINFLCFHHILQYSTSLAFGEAVEAEKLSQKYYGWLFCFNSHQLCGVDGNAVHPYDYESELQAWSCKLNCHLTIFWQYQCLDDSYQIVGKLIFWKWETKNRYCVTIPLSRWKFFVSNPLLMDTRKIKILRSESLAVVRLISATWGPTNVFYPTEDWHCRHYFQVKVSTLALRWCGVTKCKDTADLFNVSLKPGLAGVVMHSYAELTLKQTCSITKTCLSHLQAIAVDPAERDLRLLYPKTNGKNWK